MEATLLLPCFLFLMLGLYSVIDMLCLQATTTWYLHQIGNEISAYGHFSEKMVGEHLKGEVFEEIGDWGLGHLYVRNKVCDVVTFPDKVWITSASLFGDGEVELVLTYNYPLVFPVGKTKEIWLQSKYYSYAWGYGESARAEELVYITKNGEVYHLYSDCSHLKLSITQMPRDCLQDVMKLYGKTLVPCTVCNGDEGNEVYITLEQGRYHCKEQCGSLKREISKKELAWAREKYVLCQRCKERKEEYGG